MTITEQEPTTTSTLDEETRRVLAAAKGIVAAGWCQGGSDGGPFTDGPACVALAVCKAKGDFYNRRELEALGFNSPAEAFHWNDAPERTQQDVIDLIDRALQQ